MIAISIKYCGLSTLEQTPSDPQSSSTYNTTKVESRQLHLAVVKIKQTIVVYALLSRPGAIIFLAAYLQHCPFPPETRAVY